MGQKNKVYRSKKQFIKAKLTCTSKKHVNQVLMMYEIWIKNSEISKNSLTFNIKQ